jgi:hypothetical protein
MVESVVMVEKNGVRNEVCDCWKHAPHVVSMWLSET